MKQTHQYLIQLLEEAEIRCEWSSVKIQKLKLSEQEEAWVKEVMEDLEGDYSAWKGTTFDLSLIDVFQHEKWLLYEYDFDLNRYRVKTLRSELYDHFKPFEISQYRNVCRTKEQEALKSGLRPPVWTNPQAEKIFGKAEEPGDFYGVGGAGWKLRAFIQFLLDLYCFKNKKSLVRITPYNTLMANGKIVAVKQLIELADQEFAPYLRSYLTRQLDIALPES
jgi:hypothetical protein